ncbi:MAG: outer membrane lipoprotein chaperone LolA [Myxococcales bacterium]|nr:outer membrane lipoprotein chaperone LolA [Myxococcales bacterium]
MVSSAIYTSSLCAWLSLAAASPVSAFGPGPSGGSAAAVRSAQDAPRGAAASRAQGKAVAANAPSEATPRDDGLPLADVIARVQRHYDGTQSYRASFEQAQLNATFGRTTRSSGEVTFKKPGRMRWDYTSPEKKTFVSNGDVLWLYEPEDKQAFKQDLKSSQLPAALAFLMGKGKLSDQFDVEFAPQLTYGRPGDYRLSLKPKQAQSSYKAIFFIVDPQSFHVRQTVLVDSQGNINDVTFKDMVRNPKLSDATFQWKAPAGVRVIDAGKARP